MNLLFTLIRHRVKPVMPRLFLNKSVRALMSNYQYNVQLDHAIGAVL